MGVLCVGGNIARFASQLGNTGAGGQLQAVIDLTVIPANPLHSRLFRARPGTSLVGTGMWF